MFHKITGVQYVDIHQKNILTLLWSLGASSSRSGSEEATKKKETKKERANYDDSA